MAAEKKKTEDAQSEVWNAIAAFEQILDAEPNDRVALETLQEAHEKIGDQAQSLIYLCRLATVVAEEGDENAASALIEKLEAQNQDDQMVQDAAKALKELAARSQQAATAQRTRVRKPARRIDITAEMSLAWNLLQANEITQDDYTNIVQDLSESSTKKVETPISVLHVLEDRAFKNTAKILGYVSKDSGVPIISLAQFELQEATYSLLDLDFMIRRGAFVFELMGPDALVAILNPYDTELQQEVKEAIGKDCHFYLVTSAEYDLALQHARKTLTVAAAAATPEASAGAPAEAEEKVEGEAAE